MPEPVAGPRRRASVAARARARASSPSRSTRVRRWPSRGTPRRCSTGRAGWPASREAADKKPPVAGRGRPARAAVRRAPAARRAGPDALLAARLAVAPHPDHRRPPRAGHDPRGDVRLLVGRHALDLPHPRARSPPGWNWTTSAAAACSAAGGAARCSLALVVAARGVRRPARGRRAASTFQAGPLSAPHALFQDRCELCHQDNGTTLTRLLARRLGRLGARLGLHRRATPDRTTTRPTPRDGHLRQLPPRAPRPRRPRPRPRREMHRLPRRTCAARTAPTSPFAEHVAALRPGGPPALPRVRRRKDPGTLKFNHAVHLADAGRPRPARPAEVREAPVRLVPRAGRRGQVHEADLVRRALQEVPPDLGPARRVVVRPRPDRRGQRLPRAADPPPRQGRIARRRPARPARPARAADPESPRPAPARPAPAEARAALPVPATSRPRARRRNSPG